MITYRQHKIILKVVQWMIGLVGISLIILAIYLTLHFIRR